jgi:hypothetical protein
LDVLNRLLSRSGSVVAEHKREYNRIFKILQINVDLRGPHLKESTINAVIILQSFVSWARLPIISCSKTLQMMQTHDVDGKMWIFSAHAMNLVNKQAPLQ